MVVDFIKGEEEGEVLNINDYLVKYPLTTFFMKTEVSGPKGSGISVGDVLVIDRSRKPIADELVVITKDDEFLVTNWNSDNTDSIFWGVIIGLVRKF